MPQTFNSADGFTGKIVGTHKQWVYPQHLGARWFVVGIIQADEIIAQERRKLTTSVLKLSVRGRRRLEYLGQIRLHLQFGVAIIVNSCRPFGAFRRSEDGARHLKFAKFSG